MFSRAMLDSFEFLRGLPERVHHGFNQFSKGIHGLLSSLLSNGPNSGGFFGKLFGVFKGIISIFSGLWFFRKHKQDHEAQQLEEILQAEAVFTPLNETQTALKPRLIQSLGVAPDITLPGFEAHRARVNASNLQAPQLERALEWLETFLNPPPRRPR